jgi:hypothetical protein
MSNKSVSFYSQYLSVFFLFKKYLGMEVSYGGKDFQIPTLTKTDGLVFVPSKQLVDQTQQLYLGKSVDEVWDTKKVFCFRMIVAYCS